MKDKKLKILIDIVLLSIIMLGTYFFPFVNYTYKKINYSLSGFDFVVGKTICGGKVVINNNIWLIIAVGAVVVLAVLAVIYTKLKPRLAAGLMCIMAVISIVGNVRVTAGISTILKEAKNVHVGYGNIIVVLLGIVVLGRGFHILKQEKVLSSLDFMIVPGMLYFIINNYIPMVGISIAFKKIDYRLGIWNSPWCGLDNFKMLFQSNGSFFASDAWIITRNTLFYNIVFIVVGTGMGIVVGICLADVMSRRLQKLFQTTILLPQLISIIIVAYIVFALLSNETGMINKMMGEDSINFYAEKKYWPFILVFVYVWKQIGYSAIIFLSSIVGIDRSIYEASKVDGATKWMTIKNITIPMLKPTIITLTMLQVGRIFYSDFGLFYQVPMNSGALYSVTNTIDTYVYRCLMVLNNISTASAASTYQAVVGFIIVLTVNLIVRKVDKENAMF